MPSRGRHWEKLRKRVIEEEGECRVCGDTRDLEVDHIVPTSRGGSDERENLQVLCRDHNALKGAATLLEFESLLQQLEEERSKAANGWLERHLSAMEKQRLREEMFERLDKEYQEGLELTPYRPDM